MKPAQVICSGGSQCIIINEDVIRSLEDERRPVTVVSVVGPCRSGKSYLINYLANLQHSGFPLGSLVHSKTKGIWIWVGDFPGDSSRALVLLDTEGLFNPKKLNGNQDSQLVFLAMLLSSVFVYNTKGIIDSKALNELEIAINLKDILNFYTDNILPCFVWTIRDFCLKLESENGEPMSSDEYMDSTLITKTKLNDILSNRHCIVFPIPTNDQDKLLHLEQLHNDELNKNFKLSAENFKKLILQTAKSKEIENYPINGKEMSALIRTYVDGINSQKRINIKSLYNQVIHLQNDSVIELIIKQVKLMLNQLQEMFPISKENLEKDLEIERTQAILKFKKEALCIPRHPEFEQMLKTEIEGLFIEFIALNTKVAKMKCKETIALYFQVIKTEHCSGKYAIQGGEKHFYSDLENVKLNFLNDSTSSQFGFVKNEVWSSFLATECLPLLEKIRKIDSVLTQTFRNLEEAERERLAKVETKNALLVMKNAKINERKKNFEKWNDAQAKTTKELKKKHEKELQLMKDALSSLKSAHDVEDFLIHAMKFKDNKIKNVSLDIWEISRDFSKQCSSVCDTVLIVAVSMVCELTAPPPSWKSYLTDLFINICKDHPTKIAAVLREKENSWSCYGESSFERLVKNVFSKSIIDAIKSSTGPVRKTAAKIVKYVLHSRGETEKEKEINEQKKTKDITEESSVIAKSKLDDEVIDKPINSIKKDCNSSALKADNTNSVANVNNIGVKLDNSVKDVDEAKNFLNLNATGASVCRSKTIIDKTKNAANASLTGVSLSTSYKEVDESINFANASITGVSANASAKSNDKSVNVLNGGITGFSASASIKRCDQSQNIANLTATGVSISATASLNQSDTSLMNVTVSGPEIGANFEISPDAKRFGNISLKAPSLSLQAGYQGFSAGNISIGGGIGVDFNPANWFCNFGIGSSGGSGNSGGSGSGGGGGCSSRGGSGGSGGIGSGGSGSSGSGDSGSGGSGRDSGGSGSGDGSSGSSSGSGGWGGGGSGFGCIGSSGVNSSVSSGGAKGGGYGKVCGWGGGFKGSGSFAGGESFRSGGGGRDCDDDNNGERNKGSRGGRYGEGDVDGGGRGDHIVGKCNGGTDSDRFFRFNGSVSGDEYGPFDDDGEEKGGRGVEKGQNNSNDNELMGALKLANEILKDQGLQRIKPSEFSDILKEINFEDDDEEVFDLCKFCKPKNCPCCMKCLTGKSSKKIVNIGRNICGFAP